MARRAGWGRKAGFTRPEGQIRQSQVVTTFGPGAMVDLVDHAVLVGGLDFWRYVARSGEGGPGIIQDTRLRDAIVKRGMELSVDAFRQPPTGEDADPDKRQGIQVLEFPQWSVCQNPRCRALVRSNTLERKRGRYVHHCDGGRGSDCVPVRFVLACPRGHIDEFHWIAFAHAKKADRCPAPALQLLEGATGDFSEVRVRCTACGSAERMSAALTEDANPPCRGKRPWLGEEGDEDCDRRSRLLVRTASNTYFPQVVSALSVPDPAQRLRDAVDSVWETIKEVASPEDLAALRRLVPKVRMTLEPHADEDVLGAVRAAKTGGAAAQEPLRTAELKQFLDQPEERPGERPGPDDLFFARRAVLRGGLPETVASVVLAHKLREVRVQVGFTRIEPVTPDLQGEFDLGVESAAVGLQQDWLPATEVHGEGVLIQLDEAAVRAWEQRPAVVARTTALMEGFDQGMAGAKGAPEFPGARFYLLHSLSHLLLSAIALECGYSASAIRERIYCAGPKEPFPMASILLMTGTAGTEGTLGGLVEQGRRIREHLGYAFELGRLCSNDPVCAAHSPKDDRAERYLEGAACHGCLFIAECSCERFNRYLDRALVVPTLGHDPALAFLREQP
jgi:hypothetical protein